MKLLALFLVAVIASTQGKSIVECEICRILFDVVAQLEEDDMGQIIKACNEACAKLPSPANSICTQLVDQLIPQLIFAEKEGLGQDYTCRKLAKMC